MNKKTFYYVGLFLDYDPATRTGNHFNFFEVQPYQFWNVCKKSGEIGRVWSDESDNLKAFCISFPAIPLDSKIREIILKYMNY